MRPVTTRRVDLRNTTLRVVIADPNPTQKKPTVKRLARHWLTRWLEQASLLGFGGSSIYLRAASIRFRLERRSARSRARRFVSLGFS